MLTSRLSAALLTVCVAALHAAPAAAGESRYSSIQEGCLLFSTDEVGASSVCPGAFGYTVVIHDSDARIYLELVHPDWVGVARLDATRIRGSFSGLPADKVEWRHDGGAAYALIYRLSFDFGQSGVAPINRLMVARIDAAGPDMSCLVGEAATNQEAVALADRAAALPCIDR